jgi:uncharacterized protein (DUF58 family)
LAPSLRQPDEKSRLAVRDARALRIRAHRDTSTLLAGAYVSAFRGSGLTFEELRDYVPGDDVRRIEWNATARLNRPIVKCMREERDLVLALLVDQSDSLDFGFGGHTKRDAVRRAAAALAVTAVRAQDRIALATFSNGLLQLLPPAGGPLQLLRVLSALEGSSAGAATDARPALAWAADTLPRHSIVVVLSDLLFPDPGEALRRCAVKHELCVLRVADPADDASRRMAPVRVRSAESGRRSVWGRRSRRKQPPARGLGDPLLRSLGADVGRLWTGSRLIPSLQRFLEARARGRG